MTSASCILCLNSKSSRIGNGIIAAHVFDKSMVECSIRAFHAIQSVVNRSDFTVAHVSRHYFGMDIGGTCVYGEEIINPDLPPAGDCHDGHVDFTQLGG